MTHPTNCKIFELSPPHNQFSPTIEAQIEHLLNTLRQDPSRQHLFINAVKGYTQIQTFMAKMHSDTNGAPFSTFYEYVSRHAQSWKEHVEKVQEMENEVQIDDRMLFAPSLGQHQLSGIDIRVGKRRKPDDKVYQESDYARSHMPRGNFLLLHPPLATDSDSNPHEKHYFPVIRGYPKFTGQEDDYQVEKKIASKFFSEPISKSKHILVTRKENGEAGHLAVLKTIDSEYIFAIGSKNTHFLVSTMDEIKVACCQDNTKCGAYRAALPLGTAILQMIENLPIDSREMLCDFLWQTRATACFEVLCPSHQHVEALDHLLTDTPLFYALSFPDLEPLSDTKITMNPVLPLLFMQHCKVQTVPFDLVEYNTVNIQILMDSVRLAYGFEGVVNIFMDTEHNVIGIEKLKTNWYVCLRAIREKAKTFCGKFCEESKKHKNISKTAENTSKYVQRQDLTSETAKAILKRLSNIQKFTKMSDEMCHTFQRLGVQFIEYLEKKIFVEERRNELKLLLADQFPIVWRNFLQDTDNSETERCVFMQ